ncbi:MAG: hypothetical protein HC795_16725 [Coleofasciculaceae cyanobacterium RL_1_1]|nr:hypothetical protein [Coleofasciculaceae cyanobacterium RL_1_1]
MAERVKLFSQFQDFQRVLRWERRIALLMKGKKSQAGQIFYRDFAQARAAERCKAMAESLTESKPNYQEITSSLALGLPLKPKEIGAEYLLYPKITNIFSVFFSGIQTKRDDFVIDIDLDSLKSRINDYFDPQISNSVIEEKYPRAMETTSQFNAISAREKTRVGLQSDVIGASALGIRNFLCLTGDSMAMSPGPKGRMDVVDIDSIQMLWILRRLRDEAKYLDGREIKNPPQYFLGAAATPFASNMKFQALREQKKVNAGAQFFQTNVVFDADDLDNWLNEIAKRDILDKVYILIGISPLRSFKMAKYMHDKIPGIFVSDPVMKRMEIAEQKGNAEEEGIQIALELIEK